MFSYKYIPLGMCDSKIECFAIIHDPTGNEVAVLNVESFDRKAEAEAYAQFLTDSLNGLDGDQIVDFATRGLE